MRSPGASQVFAMSQGVNEPMNQSAKEPKYQRAKCVNETKSRLLNPLFRPPSFVPSPPLRASLRPLAHLALLASLALLIACAPARVVIQWTTATEINTAGFNVYRAERAEGPYTKINAQLIPASDALTGGKYQYEDTTVVAGKTYYYQLEDVEYGGATARHGPIVITASGGWGWSEWALSIGVGAFVLAVLAWRVWKTADGKSAAH